jgi:hypothetical protein
MAGLASERLARRAKVEDIRLNMVKKVCCVALWRGGVWQMMAQQAVSAS